MHLWIYVATKATNTRFFFFFWEGRYLVKYSILKETFCMVLHYDWQKAVITIYLILCFVNWTNTVFSNSVLLWQAHNLEGIISQTMSVHIWPLTPSILKFSHSSSNKWPMKQFLHPNIFYHLFFQIKKISQCGSFGRKFVLNTPLLSLCIIRAKESGCEFRTWLKSLPKLTMV